MEDIVKKNLPFVGTYLRKADKKGRVPLPQEMRKDLLERQGQTSLDSCVLYWRKDSLTNKQTGPITITDSIDEEFEHYERVRFDTQRRMNPLPINPGTVYFKGKGSHIEVSQDD